jgi:hypothetical protein
MTLAALLGWFGTGLQAISFLFRNPRTLRALQAFAALVWLSYGALIEAMPVMVANVIVASLAFYSIWRDRFSDKTPAQESLQSDKNQVLSAP